MYVLLWQGGVTGIIFVGRSAPYVNMRIRCGNPAGWFLRAKISWLKWGGVQNVKWMTKTINSSVFDVSTSEDARLIRACRGDSTRA